MKDDLSGIILIMDRIYGRDISCHEEAFLRSCLHRRMSANNIESKKNYEAFLLQNGGEASVLADELNVSYSEFFRNPLTFAVLEQLVLPVMAARKGAEIRVWSAGCAAGQEAYSMAILLEEFSTLRSLPVSYRIFATDVSESALEAARQGSYDGSGLNNLRLKHLNKWFIPIDGGFQVHPRLRERIEFSHHDLLDEHSTSPPSSIYGNFDLVFCCNLLFYYSSKIRQLILNKVCHALSMDGYLATGEVERDIVEKHGGFHSVVPPAAVFQKHIAAAVG